MISREVILKTQLSAIEDELKKRRLETQRYEIEARRLKRLLQGIQVANGAMGPHECNT